MARVKQIFYCPKCSKIFYSKQTNIIKLFKRREIRVCRLCNDYLYTATTVPLSFAARMYYKIKDPTLRNILKKRFGKQITGGP